MRSWEIKIIANVDHAEVLHIPISFIPLLSLHSNSSSITHQLPLSEATGRALEAVMVTCMADISCRLFANFIPPTATIAREYDY